MPAERRRGLADVFHYFIPEEEQKAARSRSVGSPWGARLALLLDPERPLDRSLGLDVAWALRSETGALRVVAPFPPPASWEPKNRWEVLSVDRADGGTQAWVSAIRESPGEVPLLALVPAACAGALARGVGDALSAILIPVEVASWGVPEALARIRQLRGEGSIRIGALLVGDERSTEDLTPLRRLQGAAGRQLGVRVEPLGAVLRDRASYRALLSDTPVIQIDPESSSSESLRAFARRLLTDTSGAKGTTP